MFKVIEKFISIDGEGPTAGELATFIRFAGCNLKCSWCDTTYSWNGEVASELLEAKAIYEYIKNSGVSNVTLTGGEPLLQPHIHELLRLLSEDKNLNVHIETNGSVDIGPFKGAYKGKNIDYIVDFKLPKSGMSSFMHLENLNHVTKEDVYKFVIADKSDLERAYELIKEYDLTSKCLVYLSPVTDVIKPYELVDFMKEKNLNQARLQLQLHKLIWPPTMRGV